MARRPLLFYFAVPFATLGASFIALGAASCTSSGNIPLQDASVLGLDGSALEADGQVVPPGYACAFVQRATFTCPDVTLPPPSWQASCVDGDDCTTRVNTTSTSAGCSETIEYQDVKVLDETCAAWKSEGGAEPTIDSGPIPVCAPSSAAFTPKWHAPRAKTNACTKAQIDSYRQCLDDAKIVFSPPACAEWTGTATTADQTCLTCLQSNESDPTYGPLVLLPTEIVVNIPGCLALAEGKTDGSGCGGALAADNQCDRAACLPTCPTQTSSEVTAEQACEQLADKGSCAAFEKPAECAGSIEQGDAGTAAEKSCFGLPGGTADDLFESVAIAFCGGG